MNCLRQSPILTAGIFLLAGASFAQQNSNAPLDATMTQLLRQAAAESELVADAGFDPAVVAVGEPSLYRVIVTAAPEAVDLPEKIPAPDELQLQKEGVGSSFVSKGPTSQYRTTFNYRVTARAAGTFTIESFGANVGAWRVGVPPRTLKVVAAGSPEARRPSSLRIEVPAGDFFVGQAIRAQIVALDPGDSSVLGLVEPKALGNAFIFDRVSGSQRRDLREDNGRSVSAMVEEVIAIPIREGRQAFSAQAFVELRPTSDSQTIKLPGYRPFLEAAPVNIVVRHLPGDALPGFTGLIGQFQPPSPRPASREVHAGDPFDLPIVIQGTGNLGRVIPPPITNAPGWRVVPTSSHDNQSLTAGLDRSNVFHYTLIPLHPGMTATPRIPFSYFDPQQNSYVDFTIPSIPILVLRSAGAGTTVPDTNTTSVIHNASARRSTEGLGNLARRPAHFAASLVPMQQRPAFWWSQLLLAIGLAGWYGWSRRRRFLAAHPEVVRMARARRELRWQDRRRHRAAAERDAVAYARAAVASLRIACAPHLSARPEALVCDDVLRALPPEEQNGETGKLLRQLFLFADELAFKDKSPHPETLWSLQPALETLLAELRRRLC